MENMENKNKTSRVLPIDKLSSLVATPIMGSLILENCGKLIISV